MARRDGWEIHKDLHTCTAILFGDDLIDIVVVPIKSQPGLTTGRQWAKK